MSTPREFVRASAREPKILNAKITGTSLGYPGRGILSSYLHLSGDGWGVSFGGIGLDDRPDPADPDHRRRPHAACGFFIAEVLRVVGVEKWEQVAGNYVRVESQGWGGECTKIGHITEDRWLDVSRFREALLEILPGAVEADES